MKNILYLTLLSLLAITPILSFSQDVEPEYVDFIWDEKPSYEVPESDPDQNVIGILSKSAVEYVFERKMFLEYGFNHSVIYIAKEAGIEEHNKVYVPIKSEAEVVFQKVRVISSDGKITELDESNIQEGENEENGYTYRYFAVEGLAVGSFLETTILMKGPAKYTGIKKEIQEFYPQLRVEYEVISPKLLYFSFHSINGLPEMESDTLLEEKNHWTIKVDSMEHYEDEPVSYADANLMSLIYKLSDNYYSGARDMSSYGSASNSYYKYLYQNTSKSEIKAIEKLFKEIGITSKMDPIEKVTILENHLKESYAILNYVDDAHQGIEALLQNKASDERSFIKLYANALKLMEIDHEVVLTSDRTYLKFDRKYEANNYLETILFYLPNQDLYMAPAATSLRLGYVNWENTANYGLFIKPIEIGGITSGIGKIKMIEALPYDKSQFNHRIKVDLTEDPTFPTIDFTAEMTGYHATPLQTSYKYLSEDVRTKLNESLKETFTNEKVEAEVKIENAEPELFGKEPLLLKLNGQFLEFTEDAGGKIIFKVGELIGQQSEMYHEKERIHDVENDFNRAYYRTIEILIPEGYKVLNLEKLNIDVKTGDNSAVFVSKYSQEGNKITIEIDEYYSKIFYSVNEFTEYQKVVNAAADFNKIVLILSKS